MVSPSNPWPFPINLNGPTNGHADDNGHLNGHAAEPLKREDGEAPDVPHVAAAAVVAGGEGANRNLRPKPYFVPPSVPFESFPRPMQLAILEVVQPCYEELVLGAATALERQAGASLTFIRETSGNG